MRVDRGVAGDADTVVQRSPGGFSWYLGFNARRTPLDERRVRHALAHAIDRRGPAELLRAAAAGTGGLLPPTIPGHSHRVAPAFDPDRPRALLVQVSYAGEGALGKFVLACLDLCDDAASDLAEQLAAVGIRARLLSVASDSDLAAAINKDAHAFLWAWGAEYLDPGGFLEPMLRLLRWLYRDGQLEQLLARAASLHDRDERLRTYREFERIWIGEQAEVVPLAYSDRELWRRLWVTEMWVNAIAYSTFADAVVTRPHSTAEPG